MKSKDVYSKKITSEEEQNGYVLVLKDRLSFFPPLGESFRLVQNGQLRKAKVESYKCLCRGPDEPHSHYFVKSRGLKTGDRVVIRKDPGGNNRYMSQIQRRLHRT